VVLFRACDGKRFSEDYDRLVEPKMTARHSARSNRLAMDGYGDNTTTTPPCVFFPRTLNIIVTEREMVEEQGWLGVRSGRLHYYC